MFFGISDNGYFLTVESPRAILSTKFSATFVIQKDEGLKQEAEVKSQNKGKLS
jgi:hypothetical protein